MSGSCAISSQSLENIKVAVRLRPFTEKEKNRNNKLIVDIEQNTVVLYTPKHKDTQLKRFTFDYSYWSHDGFKKDPQTGVNIPDEEHLNGNKYVGQAKVFEDLGQFLLSNALQGYNSALLAYGQTGSGKSYTVSGYGQNEGILPRFARSLFEELEKRSISSKECNFNLENSNTTTTTTTTTSTREQKQANRYEVYFSMIEIYNEVVRDLLSKGHGELNHQASSLRKGLKVREHPKKGFFVENLSSFLCADKEEIEQRIEEGQLNKSIAATSMNETSSRGHTIYEFKIKQFKTKQEQSHSSDLASTSSSYIEPCETVTMSVVQLVDLAGSERMAVHVNAPQILSSGLSSTQQNVLASSRRSKSPIGRVGTGNSLLDSNQIVKAKQLRSAVAGSGIGTGSFKVPNSASSTSSSTGASNLRRNVQHNVSLNANLQQRFKESVSINQSLSTLGNCIQVLSQYSQQMINDTVLDTKSRPKIPYRDSVLTKLLNRCCLSGNSKVVIIATLSPTDVNYDDTLSTLRFADRAKQIRTHAVINRLSRNDYVETLEKENNRLKQIVDGRVARSDDSSQTSNFDENENVMENFTGSKINSQAVAAASGDLRFKRNRKGHEAKSERVEAIATPVRSKTTIKKSTTNSKQHISHTRKSKNISSASSNPQLNNTISNSNNSRQAKLTASKSITKDQLKKSKSVGQGMATSRGDSLDFDNDDGQEVVDVDDDDDDIDDLELIRLHKNNNNNSVDSDEEDIVDVDNGNEGIISPDSDSDSFAALADEELSQEEKISIFNRLLSNSSVNNIVPKYNSINEEEKSKKIVRPKRASRIKAGIREVAMLSSNLKKTNPYLSNLNPDEQLSGMISYIIKKGETIVGKSNDSDIMLHGPELRGHHAKIVRDQSNTVFVEPMLKQSDPSNSLESTNVALMVNGSPVTQKIQLNHCDRLLFGTNAFFVFADTTSHPNGLDPSGLTIANLDLVTFDMARSEVMRKVMTEAKNEAMIKEIKDYKHRPGTGKMSSSNRQNSTTTTNDKPRKLGLRTEKSLTDGYEQVEKTISDLKSQDELEMRKEENKDKLDFSVSEQSPEESDQSPNYQDQLMEDTYEYAMPVAEVNAIAKEMGIKVTYGLKILTGEEQLPQDQASYTNSYLDSNSSDISSSSTTVTANSGEHIQDGKKLQDSFKFYDTEKLTVLKKLEIPDIPPSLHIKVHLNELGMDFYWSKEKFQARRDKMLELYGAWDVGGKSGLVEHLIEQSKAASLSSATTRGSNIDSDNNYLFDPFIDDPQTSYVLIGNAQVNLQPLSHLADIKQTYDLLDLDDETVGELSIQVIPCHNEPIILDNNNTSSNSTLDVVVEDNTPKNNDSNGMIFKEFSEDDLKERFLEEPEKIIGQRLVFVFKILTCSNISDKFVNIFCQYSLKKDDSIIKTKVVKTFNFAGIGYDSEQQSESGDTNQEQEINQQTDASKTMEELRFNSSHYICFEKVDEDILNFLSHGFLTIQVVGQYKQANCFTSTIKSPTVVSIIINSINKYKYKMQQANSAGSNFNTLFPSSRAVSVYNYTGNDSAKSNGGPSSSSGVPINTNSGASSVVSTVNMFDQQNEDEEGINSMNGLSQENVIDMILTKRKLDRAENQLVSIVYILKDDYNVRC